MRILQQCAHPRGSAGLRKGVDAMFAFVLSLFLYVFYLTASVAIPAIDSASLLDTTL